MYMSIDPYSFVSNCGLYCKCKGFVVVPRCPNNNNGDFSQIRPANTYLTYYIIKVLQINDVRKRFCKKVIKVNYCRYVPYLQLIHEILK